MGALSSVAFGRPKEILSAVRRVVAEAEHNSRRGAVQLRIEAGRLKGLVRKALQQVSARTDIITDEDWIRELSMLQAENTARPESEIREQMRGLLLNLRFERVVKVGTVAEVSLVIDGNGTKYAMKTVSPESRRLYETDFALLDGPFVSAIREIVRASHFSPQLDAVFNLIFETIRNPNFKRQMMGEFDLRIEGNNLRDAAARDAGWAPVNSVVFVTPTVRAISEDGTTLLMDWVEGWNLTDLRGAPNLPAQEVAHALVARTFYDLSRYGRFHADLHPGNVMVDTRQPGQTRVFMIDRGLELEVPPECLQAVKSLMLLVHCDRELNDAACRELLMRIGVDSTDRRRERQFEATAEGLSVLAGLSASDTSEQAERAKFVTAPGWVHILRKSVSNVVMTLQTLKSSAGFDELRFREFVASAAQQQFR